MKHKILNFDFKFKAINRRFLMFFIFGLIGFQLQSQINRVIDNKGTIVMVKNNQVTTAATAPANPLENDIWIDTVSNTLKIWEEGTVPAWIEIASIRNWISSSQNGSYLVNHLVSYEGALYKNLTSTNLDTTPDNDTVNWKEISVDIVPLWKSQTNGGSYATNDIINHNGILYKNLTGTNSDTTPIYDSTNWRNVTARLSGKTSIGVALAMQGNFPAVYFNGTLNNDEDVEYATENPTYRIVELLTGSSKGELKIQIYPSRPAGTLITSAPIANSINILPTGDVELPESLSTDAFSTKWSSLTDGGTYQVDHVILYNGRFYKNLTGTNLDTTPNLDTTNWEALEGEGSAIPLWKSQTNGGSYATNDMINYNGIIYKNLTGTNSDTTPDNDISNWEVLNASLSHSTGIQSGGILSVGTPNTTFSISDGFGYIVDNVTDPYNPIVKKIIWSGKTNLPATSINSQLITFISIDENGNVIQQSARWTREQRRDQLVVGVIVHVNQATIDVVNNEQQTGQDAISQIYDILEGLGFINVSGNVFGPNGANLFIDKTEGVMLGGGINYANSTKNPHQLTLPQLSAANVQYRTQTGVNITGLTNQNIDPDIYDVGGTSTTVPNNKFTIQRIYSFTSNNVKILPGQALYNSMADAIAAIGSEAFVTEPSIKANGMLRGFLVIQKGTVALNNPLNAKFIEASRIAGTAGASSASSGLLEVVPLWKSNTDGGLYQSNDILNFNGYLYKNLTGANTDTTPENDTVNWVKTIDLAIQLSDADGDTKIEVEQAADEDIIRFTTSGTERLRLDGSRIEPLNNGNSVFIGENAGTDTVSSSTNNVFIGQNTGSSITTGNGNIGIGLDALKSNTTGAYNIGIGPDAGRYIADGSTPRETGANSIYIGKDTKASVDGALNEIAIGTDVIGNGNNTITLGNDSVTELYTAADIISRRFHTIWKSNEDIYSVDDIVIYNGALYKNLTGSNTAVAPDSDTTNWKEIGVEGSVVPLWKSQTNGGSYATNDIINYTGMLYKNLTGTNSDTTPNLDTTNWSLVTKNLGTTVTINNGILLRHNWPSVGFNLGLNSNNEDVFFTSNPSYRIIEPSTGAEAGLLQIKSTQNGIAGEVRKFPEYPETTIVEVNKDGDIEVTGELKTATFSSAWINSTNGGVYAINDIVLYNGGIYKNLTGTNLDTTPNTDATNWENLVSGTSGGGYEYLIARSTATSFNSSVGTIFPYDLVVESDGSSITSSNDGKFTLAANGTYRLTANAGVISGNGYSSWRFYNDGTNAEIQTSSTGVGWGNNYTGSYSDDPNITAIIKTDTNPITIYLRKVNGTSTTPQNAEQGYVRARVFIEKMK